MKHKDGLQPRGLTPIGELHKTLMDAGMSDEMYCAYRPHLKVLLKSLGRQPESVFVTKTTTKLNWIQTASTLTVELAEFPF